MSLNKLKIAIVCDWLTNSGGAEKVILGLHQLFPQAPIYTSLYNPEKVKGFEKAIIYTSVLQKFPWAKKKHQLYLAFLPYIFEQFNLNEYDIVISSSHSCAKGIITKPETLHICYCHSPMRYAWEDSMNYIKEYKIHPIIKKTAPFFIHKIRMWDFLSADRVDYFLANSSFIQKRIFKYYRKNSTVIHPFIESKYFKIGSKRENFFLAIGRITPYKRFDLLVDTFNQTGLPLIIAGTGIAEKSLRKHAKNNIKFLGHISDETRNELYQKAKAFLFPQVEDFGITPLEAMATGCPVIAYKKGGALETIISKKTGIFFEEQTVDSLKQALQNFQNSTFNNTIIRQHAEKFDRNVFNKKLLEFIEKKWHDWQRDMV